MRSRSRAPWSWLTLPLVGAGALVALALSASCSGGEHNSATSTAATGSGGAPATAAATGGGSSATTGAGGEGGNVSPPECVTSTDCAASAKGPVCDVAKGVCVECTPIEDVCVPGQYCTAANECQVGCTDASDCAPPTVCNPSSNLCVNCTDNTHCAPGTICAGQTCVPGCSPDHACQIGFSCCGTQCIDLETSVNHCSACNTPCPVPPQASATCASGQCGILCDPYFADCNLDATDGCEHNLLQDGPCTCVPGATQACYTGAPGTQNVGICKGGIQTCDPQTATFGPCVGQVLPLSELCNGLDDDCDGAPEAPGCVGCQPGTGSCNGQVGTWCQDDGLGFVTEVCDPLQNTTCNPQTGKCDGACGLAALGSSYIGCDYYPTVTANLVATQLHFAVAVSNTSATTASVVITQGATSVASAAVAPGAVQVITLPWQATLKGPASGFVVPFPLSVKVTQGAYRLRSDQPVTVYQFNPLEYVVGGVFSYSNDASILLPVNVWTGHYRVAAQHHFYGGSGFYAVTAKEDGTTVTVSPSPAGGLVKTGIPGLGTNGAGIVTLNAGDVMEVVTNGALQTDDPNDVTGTLVLANKPVQVIGGHQCINIPHDTGYCDHLEESIFPFETLSTEYIVTAPLIPTGGQTAKVEFVRIVATTDNTTLTYDPPQAGAPTTIAQAGLWVELQNNASDFAVTANQPVLVVQYMEGQLAGGNSGDPSMTIAVAKDQYRDDYLFHAPTNYDYSYANITAPAGATVSIDGVMVGGFTPVGNSGYSVARTSLSNAGNGNHQATGSAPFGISVYGYGQYTSYWYPGGSNLTKLHD